MKRAALVGLLMGLLNGGMATAASISGKIVDEVTNLPLNESSDGYEHSSAYGYLYQYDSTYGSWNYYGYLSPDTTGQFSFTNLSAGQYVISGGATGYFGEYYNNAKDWDSKKVIALTATRNLTLQDIKLTPLPVYIKSITQSANQLPSGGGNVDLMLEINNGKAINQNVKLWVTSWVWGNSSSVNSPVTKTPLSITLVPGNNTVTVPITIPASYINGYMTLYINLGKTYGNPVAPYGYADLYKGDSTAVAAKTAPTTAKPVAEEIPLRIADDGKVLLKGPRPQ